MAGIDRGDSIRRPSEGTLSPRALHRGREGELQVQPRVLESLRQVSPAVAVVVEQKNLGSDAKPLFDLVMTVNNEVIRARSERPFPPGTVLLIEVTPDDTINVLPKPDSAQQNRMIQASLSFWQAHTLPRVHPTQLPPLPDAQSLKQLASDHPALRPLLDWLNQTPQLNRITLSRWAQDFMPLNTGRPVQLPIASGSDGTPNRPQGTASSITSAPPSNPNAPGSLRPLVAAMQATLTSDSGKPPVQQSTHANRLANTATTTLGPIQGVLSFVATSATKFPIALTQTQASPPNPVQVSFLNQPSIEAGKSDWQPLPAPEGSTGKTPIEIRLSQWLGLIDDRIQRHPTSLQQSLVQRARQLLHSPAADYARQAQATSGGAGKTTSEALQPLLQLRNWADAVQGKTQNNAIQQALSAFAQADSPTVQQVSIPLVWLGPSAWANLEWWQEKERNKEKEGGSGGKRLWRFRLFFELTPLAPLCADLVWEPEKTQVTFWSQDHTTLAFLNAHIGTLEQWTEGLGERELLTRHGMPRKKSTPDPEQFKPLVDIRT